MSELEVRRDNKYTLLALIYGTQVQLFQSFISVKIDFDYSEQVDTFTLKFELNKDFKDKFTLEVSTSRQDISYFEETNEYEISNEPGFVAEFNFKLSSDIKEVFNKNLYLEQKSLNSEGAFVGFNYYFGDQIVSFDRTIEGNDFDLNVLIYKTTVPYDSEKYLLITGQIIATLLVTGVLNVSTVTQKNRNRGPMNNIQSFFAGILDTGFTVDLKKVGNLEIFKSQKSLLSIVLFPETTPKVLTENNAIVCYLLPLIIGIVWTAISVLAVEFAPINITKSIQRIIFPAWLIINTLIAVPFFGLIPARGKIIAQILLYVYSLYLLRFKNSITSTGVIAISIGAFIYVGQKNTDMERTGDLFQICSITFVHAIYLLSRVLAQEVEILYEKVDGVNQPSTATQLVMLVVTALIIQSIYFIPTFPWTSNQKGLINSTLVSWALLVHLFSFLENAIYLNKAISFSSTNFPKISTEELGKRFAPAWVLLIYFKLTEKKPLFSSRIERAINGKEEFNVTSITTNALLYGVIDLNIFRNSVLNWFSSNMSYASYFYKATTPYIARVIISQLFGVKLLKYTDLLRFYKSRLAFYGFTFVMITQTFMMNNEFYEREVKITKTVPTDFEKSELSAILSVVTFYNFFGHSFLLKFSSLNRYKTNFFRTYLGVSSAFITSFTILQKQWTKTRREDVDKDDEVEVTKFNDSMNRNFIWGGSLSVIITVGFFVSREIVTFRKKNKQPKNNVPI
jgi:hypothetical protein